MSQRPKIPRRFVYYLNLDKIVHGFDQSKEIYFGDSFVLATDYGHPMKA